MKKAISNGRGGPAPALSGVEGCPPIRRADTQVGPYTRPAIEKRPRGRKWVGIFAIVLAFVFGRVEAVAQQPTNVPRIGYLAAASSSAVAARADAFRQGLRELGYVEGKNILIESLRGHIPRSLLRLDRLLDVFDFDTPQLAAG